MIRESNLLAAYRALPPVSSSVDSPMDRNSKSGPVFSLAKEGQPQKASAVPVINTPPPLDPGNLLANWTGIQNLVMGMNLRPGGSVKSANPFGNQLDVQDERADEADGDSEEIGADGQRIYKPAPLNFDENPFETRLNYQF